MRKPRMEHGKALDKSVCVPSREQRREHSGVTNQSVKYMLLQGIMSFQRECLTK